MGQKFLKGTVKIIENLDVNKMISKVIFKKFTVAGMIIREITLLLANFNNNW